MKELSEERVAVGEAVSELWTHENLPFTIWGWEDAKEIPSGKHPDEVQSKGVRDSDIYVLILGSEYGDFEYGESPTHKEYDIACSEHEQDCILIYIKEVERRREEKLEKWIEEIKNRHTFKAFENRDPLKNLVKTRLRDLWNKGKWKADIPTIQSTLRKGETFEGDFFKKEPEWIDFEEGFVVERREVDEIIKKLGNNNIQLVLGEPASGKSVILKNVGFKLAKENKDIYIVELKKHSRDEVKRYFDDVPEIKDEKTVFIVDDAHLLPTECERLVRDFKNRNSKTKIIIGSRETKEIKEKHPKEASEFGYLSKTDIQAKDVTEEMISGFLKRKYDFNDERIERVSKNLEKYKKDLWHLSWALKAYNPEKDSVEEEEIYEKIKESIRNVRAGKDTVINAEDVFLPLSVFYRFEIPVEQDFLEEQLEIEEDTINKLVELSEIIETEEAGRNRMLSLNHSSIAELYFETSQVYPSLGKRSKKKILDQSEKDLEYCLFYKYMISTDPRNAIDVVINLKWRSETLLKKLIEDERVKKSISEGIEKDENIEKIWWCLHIIALINKEAALKLFDAFLNRIEKEEDIEDIGIGVWLIARESKEMALKLVNIISPKIKKEGDIIKVGKCVRNIAHGSEEGALKLVSTISSKIEKEKDIIKIIFCMNNITRGSNKVALKLVGAVSSRMEKEEEIEIKECITSIAVGSEEVARENANCLNPKLREELQKEGWLQ